MCRGTHWQAARSKCNKTFSTLDGTGLVVAGCRHVLALKAVNMFAWEQYAMLFSSTSYFGTKLKCSLSGRISCANIGHGL